MSELPVFKFALVERVKDDKRFLPQQGEPQATGYDVRACMTNGKSLVIRPGQYVKIPLGYRCFISKGWWYEIKPRSSSFAKKHLHCLYGTVDENFALEAVLAAQYVPDVNSMGKDLVIEYGEAIGQIIPVKRQEMIVEEITNEEIEELYKNRPTERKGGFGSTSK